MTYLPEHVVGVNTMIAGASAETVALRVKGWVRNRWSTACLVADGVASEGGWIDSGASRDVHRNHKVRLAYRSKVAQDLMVFRSGRFVRLTSRWIAMDRVLIPNARVCNG